MGYSFPVQDIVALTVRSILCMITTLSVRGELHFSVHPSVLLMQVLVGGSEIYTPMVHNWRKRVS